MRPSIPLCSRVAAVSACVASPAVMAAPAHVDPSASERNAAYLDTLEHCGQHLSRDGTLAQGVAACLVLDEPGETPTDVVTQVIGMHSTWNRIDAEHFVRAAHETYRPNKPPRGARYPVCSANEVLAVSFQTANLRDGNRRPRSERAPRDYEIAGGRADRLAESRHAPASQRHLRTAEHLARLRHSSQTGVDRTADPVEALPQRGI